MKLANGYRCDFCKLGCDNIELLKKHFVKLHKDSKKCDVCDRTFSKGSNFQTHFLYSHNEIVRKRCDHCNKEFSNAATLRNHFRTIHNKQKDFKCEHSANDFGALSSLKLHTKTVHMSIKSEQCNFCPILDPFPIFIDVFYVWPLT